jgi:esterase/lipase
MVSFAIISISFVTSEETVLHNPYQNMEIKSYNGNFAYAFRSYDPSSRRLIIDLAGSGPGSVLGLYLDNEWRFTGIGAQLIQVLREDHTIFIPEKWDRVPGIDYSNDLNDRRRYTRENIIECYVSTIDSFLVENNYSSIILVGVSEGAAILPLIYENMKNKNLVKGIVSIAAGGLSLYESYLINIQKENISEFWRNAYTHSIEMNENIENYYDSMERSPLGLAYRQMASFLNYRPFDYYRNINIPILFIHGKNDLNVAVESTLYLQDNLLEKPFDYIIYEDMGHIPMNDPERLILRNDIENWIRNIY